MKYRRITLEEIAGVVSAHAYLYTAMSMDRRKKVTLKSALTNREIITLLQNKEITLEFARAKPYVVGFEYFDTKFKSTPMHHKAMRQIASWPARQGKIPLTEMTNDHIEGATNFINAVEMNEFGHRWLLLFRNELRWRKLTGLQPINNPPSPF